MMPVDNSWKGNENSLNNMSNVNNNKGIEENVLMVDENNNNNNLR